VPRAIDRTPPESHWLSGAQGHVFLVPLMSCGAQREKDFPLLDRPELPAEKMRAEFEQGTEQQGSEASKPCEIRLPDVDAARRIPRALVPDRPVRWESSAPQ
jgi:hypothetical protein